MKKRRTAIILFFCLLTLFTKHILELKAMEIKTVPPPLKPLDASYEGKSLLKYSFGFQNLMASLLWVGVLQGSEHTPLKGNEVSWEFAQVDAITTLDPKFDTAYSYGAMFLSVLRRDKLGGKIILEKWGKRAPTYWRPVHLLGMHYYQELGYYESAAPLILRASMMKDAPATLGSLGLRFLSETGGLAHAYTTALELSTSIRDDMGLNYLSQRIRSIRFNLQKQVWKNALQDYQNAHKTRPQNADALKPYLIAQSRNLASITNIDLANVPERIQEVLKENFSFQYNAAKNEIQAKDQELEKTLGHTGVYVEKTSVPRVK